MPRYCLTLDLNNDAHQIAEYRRYHEIIWPEVRDSLFAAGVLNMEIYLLGTRMFMIMDVSEDFTFARKALMDEANSKVQEWERIMHGFQHELPEARPGEKWLLMERVFDLAAQ
jgi:L-rhamnose mutarotase